MHARDSLIWVELAEDGNIVKNYNRISIGTDGFGTAFYQRRFIDCGTFSLEHRWHAPTLDKRSVSFMLTQ